jgi:hypothetical protein
VLVLNPTQNQPCKAMPEEIDIIYKNLYFKINEEYNYLELLIDNKNFTDQVSYIASVSVMLEYALTLHPTYIVLDKLDSEFEIIPELFPFTQRNIITPLKYDGVKNIICLVSEDVYQRRYIEIEKIEPFIKGVTSRAEAIDWMAKNKKYTS